MSQTDIRMWLAGRLPAGVDVVLAHLSKAADVQHIRIMPDVHVAHDVCVGTVLATTRLIYPGAIGADIGCGMAAVAFDCDSDVLSNERRAGRLLAELYRLVPANRQRAARDFPAGLEPPLSDPRLRPVRDRDGRVQLGTLGRGNHFLEFQSDDEGRLWMMVHSGSRAVGQAIHDVHITRATRGNGGMCFFDASTDEGRAFLADSAWAVAYAAANRRAMVDAAAEAVQAVCGGRMLADSFFDCTHNFVRRETHGGQELWVHRKGAISAATGQAGIIPGAMGAASFHVEGRGDEESLCSSAHGAGRVMSRTDARQRISTADLHRQLRGIWYDHRLAHALRDEAPAAYRDIEAVMRAQRDLTRVVRRLKPLLSYKGP